MNKINLFIEYAYTPDGQRNQKLWKDANGAIQGNELYFLDIDGKKAGKFTNYGKI